MQGIILENQKKNQPIAAGLSCQNTALHGVIYSSMLQCVATHNSEREQKTKARASQRKVRALESNTGWRRLIGCLKLQVIFRKRATKYRALLRKMTCKDKAFYDYTPSCSECFLRLALAFTLFCACFHSLLLLLSLSFAHTHTHTHTHTHMALAFTLFCSCSLWLPGERELAISRTCYHTHTHTRSR